MLNLFFVFLGGAIGSLLRFELTNHFTALFAGTFIANFTGCILLGFFHGRTKNIFFTTGFCGGLTTFSGLMFELITYIQNKMYLLFSGYLIMTILSGIAGIYLGEFLSKNRRVEE